MKTISVPPTPEGLFRLMQIIEARKGGSSMARRRRRHGKKTCKYGFRKGSKRCRKTPKKR